MEYHWNYMERFNLVAVWMINIFAWFSNLEEILKIVSLVLAIALSLGQMIIHRRKLLDEIKLLFKRS